MMSLIYKNILLNLLMALNQCHFNAMKRFSLRLTEAEYKKLKSYSETIQVSMNDVVRQLIREWSPEKTTINNQQQNN